MQICKSYLHIYMFTMRSEEIGQLVNKFIKENGITQSDLAKSIGIHQSQISRVINADFKKASKTVRLICEYAKIDLHILEEQKFNPNNNLELMNAIGTVWDGTEKKAKALAKVILCLKELS